MTKYSCGFAFEGNKVALIVKNRPSFMKGKLNGIGGHVDWVEDAHGSHEESFLDCMVREFREETGRKTEPSVWTPFAEVKGTNSHIMFFRGYVSFLEDTVKTVTDEQVVIVPVDSVNEFNAMYNVPWLLRMAQAHTVSVRAGNPVKLYQIQEVYAS